MDDEVTHSCKNCPDSFYDEIFKNSLQFDLGCWGKYSSKFSMHTAEKCRLYSSYDERKDRFRSFCLERFQIVTDGLESFLSQFRYIRSNLFYLFSQSRSDLNKVILVWTHKLTNFDTRMQWVTTKETFEKETSSQMQWMTGRWCKPANNLRWNQLSQKAIYKL